MDAHPRAAFGLIIRAEKREAEVGNNGMESYAVGDRGCVIISFDSGKRKAFFLETPSLSRRQLDR
jgi:hypothetical protein